jgi:hypothetical protein
VRYINPYLYPCKDQMHCTSGLQQCSIALLDSPSALNSIGWTHLEVSSSTDESVSSVLAHGAEAGSSLSPHFDGANW